MRTQMLSEAMTSGCATTRSTSSRDVRPTVSFFDDPRAAGAAAHLRSQSPGGSNSTAGGDSVPRASSEEGRDTPTKRRQSRLMASATASTSTNSPASTATVTVDIRPNGLIASNFIPFTTDVIASVPTTTTTTTTTTTIIIIAQKQ